MAPARTVQRPAWGWFALLDGSLGILGVLAISPTMRTRAAATVPLPSSRALRSILLTAVGVHLVEGAVAWRRASRDDLDAPRWALQTAIVGFPSLRLLVAQTPR